MKTLPSCEVYSDKYFQLEGMEHGSLIDKNFTLEHLGGQDSVSWRGFHRSVIQRDEKRQHWEIRDIRTNQVLATTEIKDFIPLGAVKWLLKFEDSITQNKTRVTDLRLRDLSKHTHIICFSFACNSRLS